MYPAGCLPFAIYLPHATALFHLPSFSFWSSFMSSPPVLPCQISSSGTPLFCCTALHSHPICSSLLSHTHCDWYFLLAWIKPITPVTISSKPSTLFSECPRPPEAPLWWLTLPALCSSKIGFGFLVNYFPLYGFWILFSHECVGVYDNAVISFLEKFTAPLRRGESRFDSYTVS